MTFLIGNEHRSSTRKTVCCFAFIASVMLSGCGPQQVMGGEAGLKDRPNILWLVIEDTSPILPPYGDYTIDAPNISRLAKGGVTYTNVYSPSGVCSPSRASLALGMYPSSIGANHMRTTSHREVTGLPAYEAVPPPAAKMLSQYMRGLGYYTTNNYKTDYQFKAPENAWNDSGVTAHWRNRPEGTPFFSVVNFTTSHESGLFEPYGFREIERRHYFSDDAKKITKLPNHHSVKSAETATAIHVAKDTEFPIPPYLPDTPEVRRDMWKMYNNLAETDLQIGAVLTQLEEDGLLEKTIIFFYADHGGPLPRQKRLIYDSGLKVPLIIRFPDSSDAGIKDDQLVSFVDFAPTTLSLAGRDIPAHMHGVDFISKNKGERQFIHAAADRFDGFTDSIRAVKDKRYKYIRNYRPNQAYYLPVKYREKIPTMQALLRLRDSGDLSDVQAQWFRDSKDVDELFDTISDPYELNNLAQDPKYADTLNNLKSEMDDWLLRINDNPDMSERELVAKIWDGASAKPKTEAPIVSFDQGKVSLSSPTMGASLSYKIVHNDDEPKSWKIYTQPFRVAHGSILKIQAHRIGFEPSATLEWISPSP